MHRCRDILVNILARRVPASKKANYPHVKSPPVVHVIQTLAFWYGSKNMRNNSHLNSADSINLDKITNTTIDYDDYLIEYNTSIPKKLYCDWI